LDVSARIEALGDLSWVAFLGHLSVQQTLIERPLTGTTSRLQQSCKVRLGNLESTEPDDFRLFNLNPVLVLVVAALKVLNPIDQILQTLRCTQEPHRGDETVKDAVGKLFKCLRHTNLTNESALQVKQ